MDKEVADALEKALLAVRDGRAKATTAQCRELKHSLLAVAQHCRDVTRAYGLLSTEVQLALDELEMEPE